MRMHLTQFLYGPTIAGIPLFRQLSGEVLSALCFTVSPLFVMPKQQVIIPARMVLKKCR